jgi:ABC-type dipeptide/oligopeptide/nickel transport system ATPase component
MLGDRKGCPFAPRCPLATDLCRETEPDLTVVPSVTSDTGEHRAACHYAEAVGRGDHGQVFSDGVVDNVIA